MAHNKLIIAKITCFYIARHIRFLIGSIKNTSPEKLDTKSNFCRSECVKEWIYGVSLLDARMRVEEWTKN